MEGGLDIDKTGGVAARMWQTLNKAFSDWVGRDCKHDRNRACLLEDRRGARRGPDLQHLRLRRDQFLRDRRDAFGIAIPIANIDL
jgi:hypothetical protein